MRKSGQCEKVRAWDAGTRRWCFDVGKSLLGSRMPVEKDRRPSRRPAMLVVEQGHKGMPMEAS